MDPRQQATFIPKRPVTSISSERATMGFFSLVTLIIFICMGLAAGGMYFWRITLQKQLESSSSDLVEQEKAFDKAFIAAAVRLNNRIEISKSLLNKHLAVTSLLDAIGKNTLQSVQFSDLAFTTSQLGGISVVKVTMKGVARDYTALAAQSGEIAKVVAFKDPVFSDFTLTQEGRVSFGLTMNVDTSLLEYRNKSLGKQQTTPSLDTNRPATTTAQSVSTTTAANTQRP
ncbi:MAG: hypothetical protein RLY57_421 [Candidatus Parcubacteria bacterium]|jgi:hypothetical protein